MQRWWDWEKVGKSAESLDCLASKWIRLPNRLIDQSTTHTSERSLRRSWEKHGWHKSRPPLVRALGIHQHIHGSNTKLTTLLPLSSVYWDWHRPPWGRGRIADVELSLFDIIQLKKLFPSTVLKCWEHHSCTSAAFFKAILLNLLFWSLEITLSLIRPSKIEDNML